MRDLSGHKCYMRKEPKETTMEKTCASAGGSGGSGLLKVTHLAGAELGFGAGLLAGALSPLPEVES